MIRLPTRNYNRSGSTSNITRSIREWKLYAVTLVNSLSFEVLTVGIRACDGVLSLPAVRNAE